MLIMRSTVHKMTPRRLFILINLVGIATAILAAVLSCIPPVSALTAPKRRRFAFICDRFVEEALSLMFVLRQRHSVAEIFNTVEFDYNSSAKWDVIVIDRRLPIPPKLSEAENIAILDTDLLLDSDKPTLIVPAPLSPYGYSESLYKESTLARVFNAINRVKFHLSSFARSRQLPRTFLTISTTSLILETSRMLPPWLQVVGRIDRLRSYDETRIPDFEDMQEKVLFAVFGPSLKPEVLDSIVEKLKRSSKTNYKIVAVTSGWISSPKYRRSGIVEWCDDCDLLDVYLALPDNSAANIVLTTGELSTVLAIIAMDFIPVVVHDGSDIYAREMAIMLKRRSLGFGLFEETQITSVEKLRRFADSCCSSDSAWAALVAPTESQGVERAVEILMAFAENPAKINKVLTLEAPVWYQYWFLDIYLVYGLVMVSVFILAGSIASGASSLLV